MPHITTVVHVATALNTLVESIENASPEARELIVATLRALAKDLKSEGCRAEQLFQSDIVDTVRAYAEALAT